MSWLFNNCACPVILVAERPGETPGGGGNVARQRLCDKSGIDLSLSAKKPFGLVTCPYLIHVVRVMYSSRLVSLHRDASLSAPAVVRDMWGRLSLVGAG